MTRAALGKLNRSDRETLSDHLTVCSDCAQEYRLLRRLKPLIEQAAVLISESGSVIEPVEKKQDAGDRVVMLNPGFLRRFIGIFPSHLAPWAGVAAILVIGLVCVISIISLRRQNTDLAARLKEQISMRDQESRSVAETNHQLAQTRRRAEQQQEEIAELRRSIDDLSQPQVNMPITDLDLQNLRGADGGAIAAMTTPKGGTLFTVILHDAAGPSYSEYALEILDRRGQFVRRLKGLSRSPEDTFIITLSKRLIPAGLYRLRLYGLYAGGSKLVGEYLIRVRYS